MCVGVWLGEVKIEDEEKCFQSERGGEREDVRERASRDQSEKSGRER